MEIPKKVKDEIWEYCRLNDIPNIDDFIQKMVVQGFNVEKFGATPFQKEPEIKEVIKEVEIPVEKIVEVIKEVPVEKIVEKEIYITDDEEVKNLSEKNSGLQQELTEERKKNSNIKDQMEKKFQQDKDNLTKTIKSKDEEIEKLKTEIEKIKTSAPKEDDIYNENKKGFMGSNLNQIWKKKKR
jgi:predicted RNase H-like nuclease (RuvC/YqgF family)